MNIEQDKKDTELVLKYQSGDNKALTLLVKRWHKLFCEKAFWIVKDADMAKDIAQDSWNIIIKNISNLKNAYSFKGWALRIVCNNALDVLNEKKRTIIKGEAYKYEQEDLIIEEEHNSEDLKNLLFKTIKVLPEHQQMVIKLFYVENYSLKEMSNILNISTGTIKSRLFHARERLKLTLKNRKYEK